MLARRPDCWVGEEAAATVNSSGGSIGTRAFAAYACTFAPSLLSISDDVGGCWMIPTRALQLLDAFVLWAL